MRTRWSHLVKAKFFVPHINKASRLNHRPIPQKIDLHFTLRGIILLRFSRCQKRQRLKKKNYCKKIYLSQRAQPTIGDEIAMPHRFESRKKCCIFFKKKSVMTLEMKKEKKKFCSIRIFEPLCGTKIEDSCIKHEMQQVDRVFDFFFLETH